jgi:hypothetical protein
LPLHASRKQGEYYYLSLARIINAASERLPAAHAMSYAWQMNLKNYADLVSRFQRDHSVATSFKRMRAGVDLNVFIGADAVEYFQRQFSHTLDEALVFGRSLMCDSVCTRVAGEQVFSNDRIQYRFVWPEPEETIEKILAQRLPAINIKINDDANKLSTPELNSDEEKFSMHVSFPHCILRRVNFGLVSYHISNNDFRI